MMIIGDVGGSKWRQLGERIGGLVEAAVAYGVAGQGVLVDVVGFSAGPADLVVPTITKVPVGL